MTELPKSDFRWRFRLSEKDRAAAREWDVVLRIHVAEFIARRFVPAVIENDGRRTPLRNHSVFTARYAVAVCTAILPGVERTAEQPAYIVCLIMERIRRQMM